MKRKKFSSKFKAKVAIEALKGHRTVNQLALVDRVYSGRLARSGLASALVRAFFTRFGVDPNRLRDI